MKQGSPWITWLQRWARQTPVSHHDMDFFHGVVWKALPAVTNPQLHAVQQRLTWVELVHNDA